MFLKLQEPDNFQGLETHQESNVRLENVNTRF